MNSSKHFRRVEKVCTLWTHDPSFSTEDVILNTDRFRELDLTAGSLAQILSVRGGSALRDFQDVKESGQAGSPAKKSSTESKLTLRDTARQRHRSDSLTTTFDESGFQIPGAKDVEHEKSYIFVVKDMSSELKGRFPTLQISIAQTIAQAFGLRNRSQIILSTAEEATCSASHVEISFKDQYLSRSDMWRLTIAELNQKTVYRDQRILFLGTIKATVKNVWIAGQRKRSGYFNATTRPVFRSESARFVLFVQMSREMWNFDSEGSGEIMFNKVINGFLPELFKNWLSMGARHLVSIVLFTRLKYDDDDHPGQSQTSGAEHSASYEKNSKPHKDFFRVVVSDMASYDWIKILWQLKREFRTFLRDVSLRKSDTTDSEDEKYMISGRPTIASKGNILEAINLASFQFAQDHIDRDLVRTGISVVVVTAGTGVYEVDYSMLKLTTDALMGSGISIDLVCLSPMPLHSVPLFKYRNLVSKTRKSTSTPSPGGSHSSQESTPRPRGHWPDTIGSMIEHPQPSPESEWSYAMPHWLDVSFWQGLAEDASHMTKKKSLRRGKENRGSHPEFVLRCRMYELQMLGIMEQEMIKITIPHLHYNALHPWHKIQPRISGRALTDNDRSKLKQLEREWMEDYDTNVFDPPQVRKLAEQKAREEAHIAKTQSNPPNNSVQLRVSGSSRASSSSYRPGTGYLDWRMKDRQISRHVSGARKGSVESSTSSLDAVSLMSKSSSRPSRQISFSAHGLATAAVDVSTDLSLLDMSVRPAILSRETDASPSAAFSRFTSQFRAILTRAPSSSGQDVRTKLDAHSLTSSEESRSARPSRPIKISAPRLLTAHTRSTSGEIDLVPEREEELITSARQSPVKVPDGSAIMFAANNMRTKLPPRKELIVRPTRGPAAAPTLKSPSPVSASPWLVLVNPCNPKEDEDDVNGRFRRWQHVFPRPLRTSSMKWKSLCSPASVPLTNDYFPTAVQLVADFDESQYLLSQNIDEDALDSVSSKEVLIREMIAFRLAHGFQLVIGPAVSEFLGTTYTSDLVDIFAKDYMAKEGARVFMSAGNVIHQLLCTSGGEIEVRRFHPKTSTAEQVFSTPPSIEYKPYIRTYMQDDYEAHEVTFASSPANFNWNYVDSFLAGYREEFSETLKYWRARFVLIPTDLHHYGRRPLSHIVDDSAEENRLEGIRKLTQVWQRNRVIPVEERAYQSVRKRKDPNPLAIEYQTRDPSAIVAAPPEAGQVGDIDNIPQSALFSENETYSTKNVDLKKLASELQSERGINIVDRRWHFRLHYHCFVGFDLTTWLLENFRDIDSREDAVSFGNELMDQGLFQHTTTRHRFRDGQYFYQIASEYRLPRSDNRSGWFGPKKEDKQAPPTPSVETPKSGHPRPDTNSSAEYSTGEKTPIIKAADASRRTVLLSHVMRYDVDPRKKSYRPEIINLHYDRLHNPDNCYHIRIDWMNVTSKLIEDAISQWAYSVEKHGLKLVEVPMAEAAAIREVHPFRKPFKVTLALAPPAASVVPFFDATAFGTQTIVDKYGYHKAILRKMQFVLDIEAATNFPADVDVQYSWGKPTYKYSQYIHRTGIILAQITDGGDFILLANRLFNNRSSVARESHKFDPSTAEDRSRTSTHHNPAAAGHGSSSHKRLSTSPPSSPPFKPISEITTPATAAKPQTAEDIKEALQEFCSDIDALRAFYDETRRRQSNPTPSPHLTPMLDSATVPILKLPSGLAGVRDMSPSPALNDAGSEQRPPPSRSSEKQSMSSQN